MDVYLGTGARHDKRYMEQRCRAYEFFLAADVPQEGQALFPSKAAIHLSIERARGKSDGKLRRGGEVEGSPLSVRPVVLARLGVPLVVTRAIFNQAAAKGAEVARK